ncbi:hypothetical protein [Deinococcus planocerae]|uniref:hypothetical protein n=1 Tax=Deinococcus planocerae TaxID=1737569 RepID=UPI000C7F76C9|nr:hypothetical protein [Deinococcus planocerae]
MPTPRLLRFRDLVVIALLILFFPIGLFRSPPSDTADFLGYRLGQFMWLLLWLWIAWRGWQGWQRHRRTVGPVLLAQDRLRTFQSGLGPRLGGGYTYTSLPTGGVRLGSPQGATYHLYPLAPGQTVTPGQWVSMPEQLQAARHEDARVLHVGQGGGAPLMQEDEVVFSGGLPQLAEQVAFWDEALAGENAARQRGRQVEAQALGQLDGVFAGWRIRKGLMMRTGGDVDALLTRPDGQLFSVDVKSHRGEPSLHDGVLYLGRDEKAGVQKQLHHQARETGGRPVCWQPEAQYGVRGLDGLLFVGGDARLLRQTLE